jgi:hypothetical protein
MTPSADAPGPLRAQRPARRHPRPASLLRAARLTRRPRLLRPATRPRDRPPGRPPSTRQPPGRHPPRLPQDRHTLRRTHRVGTPPKRISSGCLTTNDMGCLLRRRREHPQHPPAKSRGAEAALLHRIRGPSRGFDRASPLNVRFWEPFGSERPSSRLLCLPAGCQQGVQHADRRGFGERGPSLNEGFQKTIRCGCDTSTRPSWVLSSGIPTVI